MEVVASLSQGRTASAQCGLFKHKSVPVIFEPPCIKLTHCLITPLFILQFAVINFFEENTVNSRQSVLIPIKLTMSKHHAEVKLVSRTVCLKSLRSVLETKLVD